VPHKYFSVDDIATYVHHAPPTTLPGEPPDLSRGETLLYLHGAGGNGSFFAPLMERLQSSHSPIAFDQPGHARSGELDSLGSIERMAAFSHSLAEVLGVARPVLVGHSMGGAVALQYALDHPDGVRALILIGSFAHLPVPDERVDQVRRVTEGKARREFSRDAYSPATSGDLVRQGIMEDIKTDPRAQLGDILAVRDFDARARLGEIAVPVLVLVGEDEIEPIAAACDALVEGLPNARKVVIPKAGHMAHFEQPDAAAAEIERFLGELS
jgi:3-oxoadipate enol-lactonase